MRERIKIAICSSIHPYDYSRIFHLEAWTLSANYDVDIYACAPFREKKFSENLRVIGLPQWKHKTERFRNFFILFLKLLRSNSDVYIFQDTMSMLLSPIVKLFKRKITIYDIHENYYGFIREKDWIPNFLGNAAANSYIFLERIALKFTNMVWFAVDDIAEHYKNVNMKKLVVGNFPSTEKFNKILQYGHEKKNQFVFVGSMDWDRSITQIIEAFAIFNKQNSGFVLVLAGQFYSQDYKQRVSTMIQAHNLQSKVKLLGVLPYESAMQIIAESKIGFSLHQPTYNYLRGMPLKLFEYMGLGIPVIASNFANFKTIAEKNNCGICVDPNNIDEIVNAMIYLVSNESEQRQMGQNGRQVVHDKYNWENISTQITTAIEELCDQEK